ncbi:MAG: flagellar hook-basal body protein, partial [bacterium]|nr:flagellar hook-basal body protein [bacterium]
VRVAMKEIYQVTSAALGQEMRLAQIANNLANVNTVGYKQDQGVFVEHLKASLARETAGASARSDPSAAVWPEFRNSWVDLAAGPQHVTGRPLDVAIDGEGFFQVENAGGAPLLTRAGNFQLNSNSELVTAGGRRVLDNQGSPIRLDLSGGAPTIGSDGTISVGGATAAILGVVSVDDPRALVKTGDGCLTLAAGAGAKPLANPSLRPETIEGSNVSAIGSMIEMIQTERMYQANQKVIQTIDEVVARRIEAAAEK